MNSKYKIKYCYNIPSTIKENKQINQSNGMELNLFNEMEFVD